MSRIPSQKYLNNQTSRNDPSINNSKMLCYVVYITLTSRNSSISLKTDKLLQIQILDQDKKNLQHVVDKQRNDNDLQRDLESSQSTKRNTIYSKKIKQISIKNGFNDKSKSGNNKIVFLKKSNILLNTNQEAKQQTVNLSDAFKTPICQKKQIEDLLNSKRLSNIGQIQELKQQLNERDSEFTKIKEELTKCQSNLQKESEQNITIQQHFSECQNELQIERQQIIKLKEENTKLNEILSQKQIEMDQLLSKNSIFLQVIKKVEENISSVYQKEVKILVKQI